MHPPPTILRRLFLASSIALASLAFGCSSNSAPTSGGPLGNPDCDGSTCDDASVPLDSSEPDTQFRVDTATPDTQGAEAPSDGPTDVPTDAPGG